MASPLSLALMMAILKSTHAMRIRLLALADEGGTEAQHCEKIVKKQEVNGGFG